MLFTVGQFCDRVESDLAGLIDDLQDSTGRTGDNERQAWIRSLPKLSVALAKPQLADLHIHMGQAAQVALEYRLPASSAWCDAVLLGRCNEIPSAVIFELKDWVLENDKPGPREGLIEHMGTMRLHPAAQVEGYAEYCQRFHSAVLECGATVHGCVFFTGNGDAAVYRQAPHTDLVAKYPVFTNREAEIDNGFVPFVASRLQHPDEEFAQRFEEGCYKQDRNFVRQVSQAIQVSTEKPFVLLDAQRLGFEQCMNSIDKLLSATDPEEKLVVIIEGPPGSGKSVIAAQLWAALAVHQHVKGNAVMVTTSGCQRSNWEKIFKQSAGKAGCGFVKPANQYNPGLSPRWVKQCRADGMEVTVDSWRDNVPLYLKKNDNKVPDNSYDVSIVDEAHALIDPTAEDSKGIPPSGWAIHAGPQAWHVIRASRVSVFLMDTEQSYRDNETTTRASVEAFAKEQGVRRVTTISLADSQFRCGGSKEYVDWLDGVLELASATAIQDRTWRRAAGGGGGSFIFELVDDPQTLEDTLRRQAEEGKSVRLVSSYSRQWKTAHEEAPHDVTDEKKDFHLSYVRDGAEHKWSRIWNYAPKQDYTQYIQAPEESRMHTDALCEVGCPYVVRGFDFDYLGVLWLGDLVRRGDRWVAQSEHIHETAWPITKAAAKRAPSLWSNKESERLRHRLARGYRILLTRAIRGVHVWIEDEETRDYVRKCLTE